MRSALTEPETQVAVPRRFAGAADIHSHTLPGIDDGATSLENSLTMLRVAARYGTSLIVATPHRYYEGRENTPDILRPLHAQVCAALRETKFGPRIRFLLGQEVPLTLDTADELRRGAILTLGDTGVYVLVEPPFDFLHDWTTEALTAIVAAGFHPVLAHPERNDVVKANPESAAEFVRAGALLQLTAQSVTGENGKRPLAAANWLLENGLAHIVASDCHSPTWRPPTMRGAYHTLRAHFGLAVADRLCITNPRAVALGQPIR